jgi:hypothetical protein
MIRNVTNQDTHLNILKQVVNKSLPATDFEISLNNSIFGAVRNLDSKYENCINNFIYSQNYSVGNNPENMSSFKLAFFQTKVKN